jgi:hypothetical protein
LEDYLFQEGFPFGLNTDFETDIFLSQHHLQLQASSGWVSFAAVNKKSEKIEALVHYHLESSLAKSPYRSPYGSFNFSESSSSEFLSEFVSFTEQKLKDKGVKSILLRNPPDAYDPGKSERLQNILLQLKYKIELEEVSTVIPVGEDSFESLLQRSHKKKLKKCRESGFVFRFLSLDHLEEVYGFLKTVREEKNYALSMSLDELKKTADVFPSNYLLSVVKDKGTIIAANISIYVNSRVLYNFYHDHLSIYDGVSPVVMLNEGLHDYCQQHRFKLLDLGTSTINGKPDTELITFKVRLGGQPTRKLTFVKSLN